MTKLRTSSLHHSLSYKSVISFFWSENQDTWFEQHAKISNLDIFWVARGEFKNIPSSVKDTQYSLTPKWKHEIHRNYVDICTGTRLQGKVSANFWFDWSGCPSTWTHYSTITMQENNLNLSNSLLQSYFRIATKGRNKLKVQEVWDFTHSNPKTYKKFKWLRDVKESGSATQNSTNKSVLWVTKDIWTQKWLTNVARTKRQLGFEEYAFKLIDSYANRDKQSSN